MNPAIVIGFSSWFGFGPVAIVLSKTNMKFGGFKLNVRSGSGTHERMDLKTFAQL